MDNPRDLRSLLSAVRRRWRAEVILRAGGRAAAAAAALLVAALVAAGLLRPGDGALALLVSALFLAAVAAAAAIAWRLPRAPRDRQVARFIEEQVAARGDLVPLNDVLVSAVRDDAAPAAALPSTPTFHALVVEDALRRLTGIGPQDIVTPAAMRRAISQAVAGAVALALAAVLAWPVLARASETLWVALFPRSIQLAVFPGDTRLPAGQPLTIRASVRSGKTLLTGFTPSLAVSAGGEERVVGMSRQGDAFEFSFESIDRTFRYRVTAGSARSAEYTVTALFAPRVQRIDLRYEYPAFTKLAPRDDDDGGDIYAPAGTKIRFRIHADKPIASGRLMFGRPERPSAGVASAGASSLAFSRTGERVVEGELILSKDDSYRIGLTAEDGLQSTDDTEYFIRVMDDRPPEVRIMRPAGDQQITPLEEVAIEARADDDHGISRFELVYAVAGQSPKVIPFDKATGNDQSKVGTHVVAAEDLRVRPGDVISYYARALDVGRGKRPTETRSDMYFLEVRPFSEEYVLAQSQGMTGLASEQIESLIAAQKEIINATWNIERRAGSGAGRSADDINAIAGAQAELKARAEQMISRTGRPRGVFRDPMQIAPQLRPPSTRSGGDPVATAIQAMGRAIDQLQGQRTGEALPHEMAALQGLLQAQAEIRRREISQQTGSSLAGLGRQGQDLSALFDKELQRQQRTNYETRSQLEDTSDRQDGESALDRIRDLARRQEELSRRLRELANASTTPEERKRQLEKLTREQEALREQAEQVAREMGQQGEQRGSTSHQAQGGGEMREAANEMSGSAGELRRDSPASAAERAARAAAQLRKLEQQLQGDSADARQRAAGELRLEAQQIADEQRRIAGDVERLEKASANANADAWRRLAGEKENLADRVDDMQRAAERLAAAEKRDLTRKPGQNSEVGQQAAAVARDLVNQRLANRMRELAQQMRSGNGTESPASRSSKPAPARPSAEAERQIARALDQAVERLGGATGDAQELARQLDETRAIRERLDRLQRDVKEAESRPTPGRQGRAGTPANGSGDSVQRLREDYAKELQRTRETLSRLQQSSPGAGVAGTTPENHEWSVTDQGTEAFKQDFSKWELLRKDIDSALERYEALLLARAARRSVQDRLSGGGSDRVPDAYRQLIARYYESLARKK
jgi:hypothetical protein